MDISSCAASGMTAFLMLMIVDNMGGILVYLVDLVCLVRMYFIRLEMIFVVFLAVRVQFLIRSVSTNTYLASF